MRSGFSWSWFKAMVKSRSSPHICPSSVTSGYQWYAFFMAVIGSNQKGKRPCSELAYHHFLQHSIGQSKSYGQPNNSGAEKCVPPIEVRAGVGDQNRGAIIKSTTLDF